MAGTIRDFLIALGFQVKGAEQKHFEEAIEKATVKAELLAEAIEEMTRKVFEAVSEVAESFDRMFFAAERNHVAATTLKAIGYAASQTGSSIAGANDMWEKFGRVAREKGLPAAESLLVRYGAVYDKITQTWDIDEELRRKNFLSHSETQNEAMNKASANLGPNEMKMLGDPNFGKFKQEELDREARAGITKKSFEDANKFRESYTRAWAEIGDKAEGGLTKLMAALIPLLDKFNEWMKSHSKEVDKAISAIVDALVKFITTLSDDLKNANWKTIGEKFDAFVKAVENLSTSIGGLTRVFEAFFAIWALTKTIAAIKLMASFAGLMVVMGGVVGLKALVSPDSGAEYAGGGTGAAPEAEKKGWFSSLLEKLGLGGGGGEGAGGGAGGSGGGMGQAGTAVAKGQLAANQKEAYAAARAEGMNDTAARAVVANLSGESLTNPANMHWDGTHFAQGMVQWSDVRAERIKHEFGKYPRDMTIPEQMKASVWEMKKYYPKTWEALQGNDPEAMMNELVRRYESPADAGGQVVKRLGFYQGFNPAAAGEGKGTGTGTGGSNDFVIGDSLAEGLKSAGHAEGDAVQGRSPRAVLEAIQKLTKAQLAGKRIVLSTGASNRPSEIAEVEKQLDYLTTDLGVKAKDIRIIGVGDRSDFAGINEKLQNMAKAHGAMFVPLGPNDGVHKTGQGYRNLWKNIPDRDRPLSSATPPGTGEKHVSANVSNTFHVAGGQGHLPHMVASRINRQPIDLVRSEMGAVG